MGQEHPFHFNQIGKLYRAAFRKTTHIFERIIVFLEDCNQRNRYFQNECTLNGAFSMQKNIWKENSNGRIQDEHVAG
jgi:hypothetical protein